MAQNISRPLYLHFILTSMVSKGVCYVVFGTFVGQSNVLRLIKVFTVTDLPIHAGFFICSCLPKFMQSAVYIYIYIYEGGKSRVCE